MNNWLKRRLRAWLEVDAGLPEIRAATAETRKYADAMSDQARACVDEALATMQRNTEAFAGRVIASMNEVLRAAGEARSDLQRDIQAFEERENFDHQHAFAKYEAALYTMQELERKVDALAQALGVMIGPGDGQRASVHPINGTWLFNRAHRTVESEMILRRMRTHEFKAIDLLRDMEQADQKAKKLIHREGR